MPQNPQSFDPDLVVSQVIDGNKDAYRLIVAEYSLLVRGFLSARIYHLDDAEDLAQETFVTAYEKLEKYEIGTNFRAWLMSIAQFLLNNHWRKYGRRATVMEKFRQEIAESIQPELMQSSDDHNQEKIKKLLQCISKLPQNLRQVVRSGLEGKRIDDLSEELNLKPNAIYQLRHRAHLALKECMNQEPPLTQS